MHQQQLSSRQVSPYETRSWCLYTGPKGLLQLTLEPTPHSRNIYIYINAYTYMYLYIYLWETTCIQERRTNKELLFEKKKIVSYNVIITIIIINPAPFIIHDLLASALTQPPAPFVNNNDNTKEITMINEKKPPLQQHSDETIRTQVNDGVVFR